jgi:hypothetical protein
MRAADLQHVEFMVGEKDSSREEVHGLGNLICPLRGGREEVVEGRNLVDEGEERPSRRPLEDFLWQGEGPSFEQHKKCRMSDGKSGKNERSHGKR